MSWGKAQRLGKERAARERRVLAQKLESFHYAATNGGGVRVATAVFEPVPHTALDTARRLGYTLVLRQGPALNEWSVQAVKL